MKDEWKKALGAMTYGIYALTSCHQDDINGMIASWVSQVSYEPLLISVAVHQDRFSHGLIRQSRCFALHALTRAQSDFLQRFKGSGSKEKFSGIQWRRGITGCPVLSDCLAYFECAVKAEYTPGNHTLFIGEVLAAQVVTPGDPLSTLDYDGVYLGQK
ncbi:MAG: flavin reductase family protein [Desulfobacterales bacterium]|jgi:flavin reductase (DIM6/NTAB) family NADH-FMN oxidoreductase RutF